MTKQSLIRPIIMVTLLALLLGMILGVVNDLTKHQIAVNLNFDKQKSVLYTFDFNIEALSKDDIYDLFNDNLVEHRLRGIFYYSYRVEDELIGYSFPFSAKGLWGSISGYLALDYEATELLGIVFVDHEETPGLGARIDELWFKEQFRGLDITGDDAYIHFGTGGLDTITGATITIDSITLVLNQSIKEIKGIIEEDINE